MSNFAKDSALDHLQRSLDSTIVLSNDYKGAIIAWAMQAQREGYEKGREAGRAETMGPLTQAERNMLTYCEEIDHGLLCQSVRDHAERLANMLSGENVSSLRLPQLSMAALALARRGGTFGA